MDDLQIDLEDDYIAALSKQIERAGMTPADVSRAIGRDRNYVARILRKSRMLTTRELKKILQLPEFCRLSFFLDLSQRTVPELPLAKEPNGPLTVRPSDFAKWLASHTQEALSAREKLDLAASTSSHSNVPNSCKITATQDPIYFNLIEHIDKHPRVARDMARSAALDSAAAMTQVPEDALRHASLLTVWAIAALRTGLVGFASRLAVAALEYHGEAVLSPTYPPLLRLVTSIFDEMGERSLALGTAQHLSLVSNLVEDSEGQAKTSLSVAVVFFTYGLVDLAAEVLARCKNVPQLLRFRFSYTLAYFKFASGDLDESQILLAKHPTQSTLEELHRCWLKAKIHAARGQEVNALQTYRLLLEESEGHLRPTQRLLIFLDVVPLLRRIDDKASTMLLATTLLGDLDCLEKNKYADAIRADVIHAATRGVIRLGIEELYRKPLLQDT